MSKPRIIVTGATGKTGSVVVTELLKAGYPVRAMVHREDGRSARLREQGAEIVAADMSDAECIFNGLIALDSKLYYGYAGLGAMTLADEKLEESVRWLTRAAELNSNDPTVHANLGEARLRQGVTGVGAPRVRLHGRLTARPSKAPG